MQLAEVAKVQVPKAQPQIDPAEIYSAGTITFKTVLQNGSWHELRSQCRPRMTCEGAADLLWGAAVYAAEHSPRPGREFHFVLDEEGNCLNRFCDCSLGDHHVVVKKKRRVRKKGDEKNGASPVTGETEEAPQSNSPENDNKGAEASQLETQPQQEKEESTMAAKQHVDGEQVQQIPVDVEPGTVTVVASTVWDKVANTSFAIGAAVGAVLMWAGLRLVQVYLSGEEEVEE